MALDQKGWPRWVLCASAIFMCHVLTTAYSLTFGIFYLPFLESFQSSSAEVAWVGSLNYGVLCLTGPLASYVISRRGCRVTLLIGGFISAAGLIATSFAHHIYIVYGTFGLVSGLGYGFTFAGSVVAITVYLPQHRAFFMGFSMAGGGVGSFIHPITTKLLMDHYGWRGAMLIMAGVTLNTCAAALVLGRAPKSRTTDKEEGSGSASSRGICTAALVTILISCFLFNFGMTVTYLFITPMVDVKGYSEKTGALVLSSLGISNVIGRVFLGFLANLRRVDVVILYFISYLLAGVSVILLPFWTLLSPIVICAVIFGLFSAAYGPVLAEIACLQFGLHKFGKVYGFLLLAMGMGSTLAGPLAGWLLETSGHYPAVFWLGGGSVVTGGLVILVVKGQACVVCSHASPAQHHVAREQNIYSEVSKRDGLPV